MIVNVILRCYNVIDFKMKIEVLLDDYTSNAATRLVYHIIELILHIYYKNNDTRYCSLGQLLEMMVYGWEHGLVTKNAPPIVPKAGNTMILRETGKKTMKMMIIENNLPFIGNGKVDFYEKKYYQVNLQHFSLVADEE